MKRGTIVIILFILIALGVVGASLFLQNQPPMEITVVVDPLAEDWMRQMVTDFNNSDTRINSTRLVQVNMEVRSDIDVWLNSQIWTTQDHPDAWIPSSSISIDYSTNSFDVVEDSIAKTPLVIGAYSSRADVLTNGSPLSWDDIFNAAETESWASLGGESGWQFVNIAFTLADSKMCGLATLYSAAADLSDSPTLSGNSIRGDFYDTFEPVVAAVPNFNTIGNNVASYMARGTASADIGIAPESVWLNGIDGIVANEPIVLGYPEYTFLFDFPLAAWSDSETTADTRSAVEAFGSWLTSSNQQNTTVEFGLRPANGTVSQTASLFVDAQQYGITLDLPAGEVIQPPSSLSDTRGLINWFAQNS